MTVLIRFATETEMKGIIQVGQSVFGPKFEECFSDLKKKYKPRFKVAICHGKIIGFMVYKLYPGKIQLFIMAVNPAYRRRKVGTQMLEDLISYLPSTRCVVIEVGERNREAQIFLRDFRKPLGKSGFIATKILREFFEDGEDAYKMEFCVPVRAEISKPKLYL